VCLNNKRPVYLNWLEDECFFSLCSRQHIFWGNHSPGQTLKSLFGTNAGRYPHDFPTNLEQLNEDANSAWGGAEQIINDHTIAPIFFPFQSADHIDQLQDAMKGPNLGPIKYRLGIVTGRFGGEHPLKACYECMAYDREKHGVAYWHLSHQFPGVTVCLEHKILLVESTENRQWSRRFKWLLPTEPALHKPNKPTPPPMVLSTLMAVSKSVLKAAKLGLSCRFDPSIVAQVYKEAIQSLATSKLEREIAAENFARYCSHLHECPHFSSLPCTKLCALGLTSKMSRKPRGYCHPLKHVTLILWLFGSVDLFVKAYDRLAAQQQKLKNNEENIEQPPLLTKVMTLRVTSPKGTLRPKKLYKELEDEILLALENGTKKAAACEEFSISTSTLNRILRSHAETAEKITNARRLQGRNMQRETWLSTAAGHPDLTISEVRRIIPNVYAWLYRNDNAWLLSQSSMLPNGKNGNHVNIDWNLRDEELCTHIKRVLPGTESDRGQLRKRDVYQLIPSLFSVLESRFHYPKTRAYLSKITRKP